MKEVAPQGITQEFNASVAKLLLERDALPASFHWAARMHEGEVLTQEFGKEAIPIFDYYERKRQTTTE